MTTWCQEFDFTKSRSGFSAVANPWSGQFSSWVKEVGWQGYYHPLGGPDSANVIHRVFASTTITNIALHAFTNGDPFCVPYGCSINIFKDSSETSESQIVLFEPVNGEYVYQWEGEVTAGELFINQYESYDPTLIISKLVVQGTGINPFNLDETTHEDALETAFTDLRDALQTNPVANVSVEIAAYQDAIQSAFGVTFDKEITSPQVAEDWGVVSLYFAHQGLEATAKAFETWVESQLANSCIPVDRYALFRRVMGNMTFTNKIAPQINIAETGGHSISVFWRPIPIPGKTECVLVDPEDKSETILAQIDNGQACPSGFTFSRQAYQRVNNQALISGDHQGVMTPNNLIHELGHAIDGFAGFGVKKIGSIQSAINDDDMGGGVPLHNDYERFGMGEAHLRVQYYEHAHIEEKTDGSVDFQVLSVTPARIPTYAVPQQYLLYNLLGEADYTLWRQAFYDNLYGENTRIDTFGINTARTDYETVADAFLSWVQGAFQQDSYGENWQEFFTTYMGKFLRNAAIWQIGVVAYYQSKDIIPTISITPATRTFGSFSVRLTPAGDILGNSSTLLPAPGENINIFGWTDVFPIENAPYWLLVPDNENRLVWVAPGAANHIQADLTSSNKIDPELLSPLRAFSNDDLDLLLGE
jgi:hypothetical protein